MKRTQINMYTFENFLKIVIKILLYYYSTYVHFGWNAGSVILVRFCDVEQLFWLLLFLFLNYYYAYYYHCANLKIYCRHFKTQPFFNNQYFS